MQKATIMDAANLPESLHCRCHSLQVSRIFPGLPPSEQPISITESYREERPIRRAIFLQIGGVYLRIKLERKSVQRMPYGVETEFFYPFSSRIS